MNKAVLIPRPLAAGSFIVAQLQAAREKKSVGTGSQDNSLQQVLLISQLKEIEAKLDAVGMVRSPYDGTVKKIKWVGQTNQELLVELTITIQPASKISLHFKDAD